jgi:AcrR family transcriptional regulator
MEGEGNRTQTKHAVPVDETSRQFSLNDIQSQAGSRNWCAAASGVEQPIYFCYIHFIIPKRAPDDLFERWFMANKRKPDQRTRPTKGMITRGMIIDTAHEVFKSMGYYGASISEITRRCGFSMGTFYQYFRNKEQVFLELNDLIISRFTERVESINTGESDFNARMREMVRLFYTHISENFAFHCILGESELIDRVTVGYYEAIARHCLDFCRNEAQLGNIRSLDPNVITYGLIGMCYFIAMDWQDEENSLPPDTIIHLITDLVMNGICGPAPWHRTEEWDQPRLPQTGDLDVVDDITLTRGEKTRKTILAAAGKVFGRHGLNQANIAEITREAGVAQGTFYIYFKSKAELIEGFVTYINRQIRRAIQQAISDITDRRDAEWIGMLAFFDFTLRNREIYRIVPEWELIGRDISMWYYNTLSKGYISGVQKGIAAGQIRDLPVKFLVRSLMGFTHFIGLKWIIWAARPQQIPLQLFKDIREFLLFGLKPN